MCGAKLATVAFSSSSRPLSLSSLQHKTCQARVHIMLVQGHCSGAHLRICCALASFTPCEKRCAKPRESWKTLLGCHCGSWALLAFWLPSRMLLASAKLMAYALARSASCARAQKVAGLSLVSACEPAACPHLGPASSPVCSRAPSVWKACTQTTGSAVASTRPCCSGAMEALQTLFPLILRSSKG